MTRSVHSDNAFSSSSAFLDFMAFRAASTHGVALFEPGSARAMPHPLSMSPAIMGPWWVRITSICIASAPRTFNCSVYDSAWSHSSLNRYSMVLLLRLIFSTKRSWVSTPP